MTETLIRLMNASDVVRRTMAMALFLVLCVFSSAIFLYPFWTLYEAATEIHDVREDLFRFENVISQRASLDDIVGADLPVFLEGESLPTVQANLHARISGFASVSGTTVVSASAAPVLRGNKGSQAGIKVDTEGDLKTVHEFVRLIETAQPPLVIQYAAMRGTSARGMAQRETGISGQITVYGTIHPLVARTESKP